MYVFIYIKDKKIDISNTLKLDNFSVLVVGGYNEIKKEFIRIINFFSTN